MFFALNLVLPFRLLFQELDECLRHLTVSILDFIEYVFDFIRQYWAAFLCLSFELDHGRVSNASLLLCMVFMLLEDYDLLV